MDEHTPMISIIAPVYKVAEYLPKMIESVLAQTYTDFDLWLVDDGSPDNCGEICDKAAAKDSRVKVIHKENGGAASARNAAMEVAQGKYFHFIDSDDWIEPNMLELLVTAAENTKSTLAITGVCMEYYEQGKSHSYDISPDAVTYLTASDVYANADKYFGGRLLFQPVSKLYLGDIIREHHITFPKTMWDDAHFNLEYLKYVTSITFVPGAPYHYFRSRPGSETAIIFSDVDYLLQKRKEIFDLILELYKYWGVSDSNCLARVHVYYVSRLLEGIVEISRHPKLSHREKREKIYHALHMPQTLESVKIAKPDSIVMKIAFIPIKMRNVTLCFMMGKIIGFLKSNMSGVFLSAFTKVVHGGKERKNEN